MTTNFEDRTSSIRGAGRAARNNTSKTGNKLGVSSEVVNLYSDGVRLSATIWRPDEPIEINQARQNRPAVLLCHGWGGIRDHLDATYAKKFAEAGFICLTFDYRSWGDSDGIILPSKGLPESYDSMTSGDDEINLHCRVLRKVVDPEWQLGDIQSCISYLEQLDGVDINKIGMFLK